MFLIVVLSLFSLSLGANTDSVCGSGQWNITSSSCSDWPYPRQYVNYYTSTPPVIDGDVDEKVWEEVGWSEEFVDIQGHGFTKPRFKTRMKMRWDDDWFYVAGIMEEPQAWANITQRNEVIYNDNDFEVFFDPAGTTHYYKEWEMNANNAIWDLCLNKPYLNGGYENSSRVFSDGFDMTNARSAVRVDGTLNDPAKGSTGWTVEIAFPISGLMVNQSESAQPRNKGYWRINFSRVEWQVSVVNNTYEKVPNTPEDNWLWEPIGVIDVHLPERWGYVQFSTDPVNTTMMVKDPLWNIRYSATQVYYAQCSYFNQHGVYTDDPSVLLSIGIENDQKQALDGSCASQPFVFLTKKEGYIATISSLDKCHHAQIDNNRDLTIVTSCF